LDDADQAIPVEGTSGFYAAIRVTAYREAFEESGVLIARGAERVAADRLTTLRRPAPS
jgi:hypothetical protein